MSLLMGDRSRLMESAIGDGYIVWTIVVGTGKSFDDGRWASVSRFRHEDLSSVRADVLRSRSVCVRLQPNAD